MEVTHITLHCVTHLPPKFENVWPLSCEDLREVKSVRFVRGNIARLAQSVERQALNLMVVGSSPTVGVFCHQVVCMTDF